MDVYTKISTTRQRYQNEQNDKETLRTQSEPDTGSYAWSTKTPNTRFKSRVGRVSAARDEPDGVDFENVLEKLDNKEQADPQEVKNALRLSLFSIKVLLHGAKQKVDFWEPNDSQGHSG